MQDSQRFKTNLQQLLPILSASAILPEFTPETNLSVAFEIEILPQSIEIENGLISSYEKAKNALKKEDKIVYVLNGHIEKFLEYINSLEECHLNF